jgi:hypothetical protein
LPRVAVELAAGRVDRSVRLRVRDPAQLGELGDSLVCFAGSEQRARPIVCGALGDCVRRRLERDHDRSFERSQPSFARDQRAPAQGDHARRGIGEHRAELGAFERTKRRFALISEDLGDARSGASFHAGIEVFDAHAGELGRAGPHLVVIAREPEERAPYRARGVAEPCASGEW